MVRPVESDRSVRFSSLATSCSFLLSSTRAISLLASPSSSSPRFLAPSPLLSIAFLPAHDWSSLALFPPLVLRSFSSSLLCHDSLGLLQHVVDTTFAVRTLKCSKSAHISTGTTRCIEGRMVDSRRVDSGFSRSGFPVYGSRGNRRDRVLRGQTSRRSPHVAPLLSRLMEIGVHVEFTTSRRDRKVGGPPAAYFAASQSPTRLGLFL